MAAPCLVPTRCGSVRVTTCQRLIVTTCRPCDGDRRPAKPCGQSTASGGQGTTRTRHALGAIPGIVRIAYEMFGIPDALTCHWRGRLVATTNGPVSNGGELLWRYDPQPGDPQWCLITVSAPTSGTAWTYTLNCPAG